MKSTTKQKGVMIVLLLSIMVVAIFANFGVADPEGVTPSYISNSTKNSTTPGSRSDPGGYIYTLSMNVTQQNVRWKAYVGNISGKFTLDDADGNTIYDWNIVDANIAGEVYATRNDSITWASIGCANAGNISAEETAVGFSGSATDSISNTFDSTSHVSFLVAGQTITNSSCPSIATYVNDTAQVENENALFQEVLLSDSDYLLYTSIMEQDISGYQAGANENSTYDFQMIVADTDGASNVEYFFYVELG